MTEDEMVGWHHRLHGHELEQALGDGEGQGSLEYCRPWGHKELDMTERLNNKIIKPRSPTLQADPLPAEPPRKPKNTGVGNLSVFQRIFLTQELN